MYASLVYILPEAWNSAKVLLSGSWRIANHPMFGISKIRGLGEGLVDVDYAEMVEKSCFAHGLLVESAHGLVLTGVLVRYEPIVHRSHWNLGDFPAEKLLIKVSYFLRLVSRYLEVH